MAIPEDPFMLLSFINMKLRDGEYDSLSDLCASLECDEKEIIDKLKDAGFDYIESIRQFRWFTIRFILMTISFLSFIALFQKVCAIC